MRIKTLISSVLFATALVLGGCVEAYAQSTNTFVGSVTSYFTSFNPALTNTFAPSKNFDLWTGSEYVSGINVAADLGLEYKLPWLQGTKSHWSAESVTKNAGIAGTILSQQVGVGFNYTITDTRVTGYLDGGYSWLNKSGFAEIGLRAKKALTDNTYAGLGISLDLGHRQNAQLVPNLVIFTGFTF